MRKFRTICIVFMMLMMIGCVSTVSVQAQSWNKEKTKTITKKAFTFSTYLSKDGKEAWIYNVKVDKKKDTHLLSFPKKINGAKVVKIGSPINKKNTDICRGIFGNYMEWYHGLDGYKSYMKNITEIKIPDTVSEITPYAFTGLQSLKIINVPTRLNKINSCVFYNCYSLKKIRITKNVKSISNDAFYGCRRAYFTVSKYNKKYSAQNNMLLSKDKTKLYIVSPRIKYAYIPSTVKTIGTDAFYCSNATYVFIPFSVNKIEKSALTCLSIKRMELSTNNETFDLSGQCIYEKTTKKMVVGITKDDKLIISEGIEIIPNEVSIAGKYPKYVELASTITTLEKYWVEITNSAFGGIKFKSLVPPQIVSDVDHYVYAHLPVSGDLYFPNEAKKAYLAWIKENNAESNFAIYHFYD